MDNYDMGGVVYDLELFVTTSRTTRVNVRVRCPKYGNYDKSFTVTAGYVQKLTFSASYRVTGSRMESKGFLITADDEVVAYGVNKQKYSNDAFLALPTDVLGKEYYAITYYPPYRRAQIMVVGVQDSTSVTIRFSSSSWSKTTDSYGGRTYKSGSTLRISVNRYDTFQIQSPGDLTGAYITSDKPISVFSGNRKTNTGPYGSQDHLVEHLTPVNTWGKKFATVPIPKRSTGDYFKVIASEDATSISYKCKISSSLSSYSIYLSRAGDFKQVSVSSGKYCYWQANKAILLTQIVISQKSSSEPADPAMLVIPPIEQYAADYTFTTPKYSGGSYDNYFLFVVKKAERYKLKVDGKAFPSNTAYTDIPDTEYVGGFINVADGSHTACVPTPTVVGDGIDNDCDGLIDEELCTVENQRKDDDGDGKAEEDCATPPPIDGQWASWQSWGSCSQSCSPSGSTVSGTKTRIRTCTNPAPKYDGKQCVGDGSQSTSCSASIYCPINGGWSSWGSYGSCSVTCASGTQTRSRLCNNPTPQYNGASCSGSSTQSITCTKSACPIDGGWTDWSGWGTCTKTCGTGSQTRTRSCTNPIAQHGGQDCVGSTVSSQSCNTHHCPIDGGYTDWSAWGACTVTCGGGSQVKTRTCTNPAPQYGGQTCSAAASATQSCNTHHCPINGGYTDWSAWGACTVTCGGGSQVKTRTCTNPAPQYGGQTCSAAASATQSCNTHHCPIDGGYTDWTSWGACTVTCGGGSQVKTRTCTNPTPQYGGQTCSAAASATQSCNTHHCPIDGNWNTWSAWATCSLTCGGGSQNRSRQCTNPAPQYNGADCVGSPSSIQDCNTHNCPIDGFWASWTSWGTCTKTCGGGFQSRSRTCTNPQPQYGGADCQGTSFGMQACNTQNCPIDGAWTSWGSWGSCTVTCGGGTQERSRSCTNPSPQYGGADCLGNTTDSMDCNTQICIIDGAWGSWGPWGTCTVTCGGGDHSRSRQCDNPAPANGGLSCPGDQSEYGDCNNQSCPVVAAGTYQQVILLFRSLSYWDVY
ncbi:hypothetical protein KUTeg_006666 [Tegillarca granosa]|uniref:IgGFc-binding protein N-terminal domain-containing protein n=1 Tax=Tegillarca granosa TaxID=220873 RepID=A0ABQ9FE68_TEGGR|nr:hypothetical protein KUTeg_006666 [Tegillarca granosa]